MEKRKASTARKKTAARKKPVTRKKTAAPRKKTATRKKAATTRKKAAPRNKAAPRKKTARKKASARAYSPAASENVRKELHEMHEGKLKSGRSGRKVTNPKQAIAIGLSEARRSGKKVPKASGARKKT